MSPKKKDPFAALALGQALAAPPEVDPPAAKRAASGRKHQATTLYLHPEGHRALKLYAVEADMHMHDIFMEALEAWAHRHGITAPLRAEPVK